MKRPELKARVRIISFPAGANPFKHSRRNQADYEEILSGKAV
jgi:hypothetical protein